MWGILTCGAGVSIWVEEDKWGNKKGKENIGSKFNHNELQKVFKQFLHVRSSSWKRVQWIDMELASISTNICLVWRKLSMCSPQHHKPVCHLHAHQNSRISVSNPDSRYCISHCICSCRLVPLRVINFHAQFIPFLTSLASIASFVWPHVTSSSAF